MPRRSGSAAATTICRPWALWSRPPWPGGWASERPDCCYGVDDFAADAVAFLDAARIERATLVGHSGSCFTARRVAVTHPDRVAGLVLIGAPLSLAKPAVVAFQAAVHALEDPVPAEFVRRFQGGAVHVPLPEELFEALVAESLKLPAHVVYPEMGHSPHWERPERVAADLEPRQGS